MWEFTEDFKAPFIMITHEAKVNTVEMNSKVGFFSKEIEGIPKNRMENSQVTDTITEIKSPLEDLKSRVEMRKKKVNKLKGRSIKVIQPGKHRRKKILIKK